jgi:hypothetical protein
LRRPRQNQTLRLILLAIALGIVIWQYFHPSTTTQGSTASSQALHAPGKPNSQLTPGDVLTTDANVVCVSGYTQTVRNVPESLKAQVYQEYGVTNRQPGDYEVDHLISLELGGSNSLRNLWPESYVSQPLNAHVKDKLENVLHDLVCAGRMKLSAAQRLIANDWTLAYEKYVGTLPR